MLRPRRRRGRRAARFLERPVAGEDSPCVGRIRGVEDRYNRPALRAVHLPRDGHSLWRNPSPDDVTCGCRRSLQRTSYRRTKRTTRICRQHAARRPGRPVISPARDGGALPQEHSAGVRDRPGFQCRSPRGVHHEPRTGRLWRTAGAGLLRRGPWPRGRFTRRRVRILGLEPAALCATRRRTTNRGPARAIADRPRGNDYQHR